MLRKLLVLTLTVGMLSLMASSAMAGFFLPRSSNLVVQLGVLPTVTVQGTYSRNGWATLTDAGASHTITDLASVWVTGTIPVGGATGFNGVAVGTSLLTGVGLLDRLTITLANTAATLTPNFSANNPVGGGQGSPPSFPSSATLCPTGCIGGPEGFQGRFVLGLGSISPTINITGVLGIGNTASLPVGGTGIFVTAAPFITGKARITGVGTNVISLPNRGGGVTGVGVTLAPAATEEVKTFTSLGGFITDNPGGVLKTISTVTVGGTNALGSSTGTGQVTLISPLRINAAVFGIPVLPGFVAKTFTFVPEPGTVLLLVSGAAGLVLIGRKRMKR